MNGDSELLIALALDLPQWLRNLRGMVEIGNTFASLVVLAVVVAYRHVLPGVVIQSADQRGGGIDVYRLHRVELFRVRVVGDFYRLRGVGTAHFDASWNRKFQSGRVHITRYGSRSRRRIRPNGVLFNEAFPAPCTSISILGNFFLTVPDTDILGEDIAKQMQRVLPTCERERIMDFCVRMIRCWWPI